MVFLIFCPVALCTSEVSGWDGRSRTSAVPVVVERSESRSWWPHFQRSVSVLHTELTPRSDVKVKVKLEILSF